MSHDAVAVPPSAVQKGLAHRLAGLVRGMTGEELPVRLRTWDGGEAGPSGTPVPVLRDRSALRRLMWHPNAIGLAQAYAAGEIDVDGDLVEGLRLAWNQLRRARAEGWGPRLPRHLWYGLRILALGVRAGMIGPRLREPAGQARLTGRLHSRDRDRAVVAHHYDLSNEFYRLLLGPSMAYSCAYWKSGASGYGLADAQRDKADLICRRLALRPGMRLLDLGCGWGTLSLHAARHYGADVTAVTLSERQRSYLGDRIAELGLAGRVHVRLRDYRDVDDGPYDAIAVVEMGEHVGAAEYLAFATRLHGLSRPGGRVLIQQMSRGSTAPGGGAFIEAYIAADMHMRPVGETVVLLERAGLDVRERHALREHYVTTIRAWLAALDDRWAEAVDIVGEPIARIWRLYLAGGLLAFMERRMGVDQILAVRPLTGLGAR